MIFSATLPAQNGGEVIGAYFGPTGERWVVGDAFDITLPGASEAITGGLAARLDDSGAISRLIAPGVASISHLAFDEAGKIVATAGQIAAGNELPQGSLYVEKFSDAFVAHVDPSSGKIASAQRFGCGSVDRVLGFALHEGDFLVGGVISEGLTFGGDFYATETSDAYVARFSIPGGE